MIAKKKSDVEDSLERKNDYARHYSTFLRFMKSDYDIIDPVIKTYDIASIEKDIKERQQIINIHLTTRYLDRAKAISKIMELRANNKNVLTVTLANSTSIPLSNAPDEMLVGDLQIQIKMLEAELMKKTIEN